ncbi:DUF4198 domain-containing protein [Tuwongella immobilis]|uniref:Lipoprotein n=1 Tax=Tuwongella immobilis TaxID=692036 RepID=A0A6C2YXB9_9BACT|nr:DUF4198 domain-containing protein [Tuwongella immobilis]VIP05763.1 Uncharacterized protein OS=Planctomyces brasiliensis (strain ATCC 49424 / DSM 5305 / JCM 21570 / NBRC 103401 / IFAM 1448) GN=Plabr_2204 PE=4 SV=1 [Tuwongella immobilis]VTS08882.1 Uncharacterized protein OS=Planctomyces brasiliensis (strain ATCC 49424 / DSM 5305 / JCM 21570 / NBRC 103401 / IFAM 1448) GN=Plabr_2204 PE=4 SV=1 [Tuwongella immobilis]
MRRMVIGLFLLAMMGTATGCGGGKSQAEFTPATITVFLGGQPLPNATVILTPADPNLATDAISQGVTDDKGVAKLGAGAQNGAAIGLNRVTVNEGPVPEEARSENPDEQLKAAQFMAKLKNRPIPPRYGNVVQGKLELEIKKGQTEYKLELTR